MVNPLQLSMEHEFIDVSLANFSTLIHSERCSDKIYSCKITNDQSKFLNYDGQEKLIHNKGIILYLFDKDSILDTRFGCIFDINGNIYPETIYNFDRIISEKETLSRLVPNLPNLKHKISKDRVCISPVFSRWKNYYHFIMQLNSHLLTINQFLPENEIKFIKNTFIKFPHFPNKNLYSTISSTNKNFLRVKKVLTTNLLYNNNISTKNLSDLRLYYNVNQKTSVKKNIFATRGEECKRKLKNNSELEKYFNSLGFDIIDFKDYTVRQQIAIAKGAKIIAGLHGANLTNSLFADKETKLLEIVPNFNERGRDLSNDLCYKRISVFSELDYYQFLIKNTPYDNGEASIDINELNTYIEKNLILEN